MSVIAFPRRTVPVGVARFVRPLPVTVLNGPQQGPGDAVAVAVCEQRIHHFRVVMHATGDLLLVPPDWLADRATRDVAALDQVPA